MRTVRLLAVAYPVLAVLAFAPAVPVLSAALCLAALLVTGELWLRALVREPLTPVARLGLALVAGLVSLPLIALVLHVCGARIGGRWLAAGLAVLASLLGAVAARRGRTPPRPASPRRASAAGCPPHPGHWVGSVEQAGTTISARPSPRWLRRLDRYALAVGVPALLAVLIGGTATLVYQRLPRPAEPGYTSLALAGWAAGIAHPVDFPTGGLEVPLEVSSAGEPPATGNLLVRVGGRVAGPGTPVSIAEGTRSVQVHVPAPPAGCLQAIRISLGPVSTVFYGRGPGPAQRPAGMIRGGPGRRPVHPGAIRTAPGPAAC